MIVHSTAARVRRESVTNMRSPTRLDASRGRAARTSPRAPHRLGGDDGKSALRCCVMARFDKCGRTAVGYYGAVGITPAVTVTRSFAVAVRSSANLFSTRAGFRLDRHGNRTHETTSLVDPNWANCSNTPPGSSALVSLPPALSERALINLFGHPAVSKGPSERAKGLY